MGLATVDKLLTTTRTVRKRLDFTRSIDPEIIQTCLEIAIQAPTGGNILSAVGFLRVVMIPMFVPSRMALSLLPPEVLGGQRPFWAREGRSVCLQRRDGRPGLWDKAPHG